MAKTKLLIIPHYPPTSRTFVRGEALAHGLACDFEVALLSWYYDPLDTRSRLRRGLSRLAGGLRPKRVYRKNDVTIISVPLLYVRSMGRAVVQRINTAIVRKVVEEHHFDAVLNELLLVNCAGFPIPFFIDIVDLPTENDLNRWQRQAAAAQGVVTITEGIRDRLRKFGLEAEVIGNGADLERLRRADGRVLRRRLGLDGRLVISYIGNHTGWSGLTFLLDVFRLLKARVPQAALLIVGPGSELPRALAKRDEERIEDVLFTGPVDPSEIAEYFAATDIGVLPREQDSYGHLSFPIKVIEYSASRKFVIASPLQTLQSLRLPNVILVRREVDAWVTALEQTKDLAWRRDWDPGITKFDWSRLSADLAAYMKPRMGASHP
jgi:glycosyltransferase involved in cell wall biosynthesis